MAYTPRGRRYVAIKSPGHIDRAMKRRDLSGNQLAKLAGCTRATISNMRAGKTRRVAEDTARTIDRVMGTKPGELFDYDDEGDTGKVAS